MLIVTHDIVYDVIDESVETLAEAEGIAVAAEGRGLSLIALEVGRLVTTAGGDIAGAAGSIGEPITSLLLLSVDPVEALIGTEGAHLYRLASEQVHRVRPFDELACRSQWHTPWGGPPAVRTLAASGDGTVYADIHVGSIMRSDDRGATWQPVTPTLHADVHEVTTCRAAASRVVANTAAAVYVSDDRGDSWEHRGADLDERYGRAVAVHPKRPDVMLASVSDGPHGEDVHGQLYRTENAGETWQHVTEGFPESTRENINTGRLAFTADGRAWASVAETLFVSEDDGRSWRPFWRGPSEIIMLSSAAS